MAEICLPGLNKNFRSTTMMTIIVTHIGCGWRAHTTHMLFLLFQQSSSLLYSELDAAL